MQEQYVLNAREVAEAASIELSKRLTALGRPIPSTASLSVQFRTGDDGQVEAVIKFDR